MLVANSNHSGDEIIGSLLLVELRRHVTSDFTCTCLQLVMHQPSPLLLSVRELQKSFPQSEFIKLKWHWCLCDTVNFVWRYGMILTLTYEKQQTRVISFVEIADIASELWHIENFFFLGFMRIFMNLLIKRGVELGRILMNDDWRHNLDLLLYFLNKKLETTFRQVFGEILINSGVKHVLNQNCTIT
jgi:hypothetical protein